VVFTIDAELTVGLGAAVEWVETWVLGWVWVKKWVLQ
jgi:hypothetical protein